MEVKKYIDVDESKIRQKETRTQTIEDLIREVKEGTLHLIIKDGNLVNINCTQNIRD